jgi:hypothetical protein
LCHVSAEAAVTHKLIGQVAEVPATGPHGESIPYPGPFHEVEGIALDSGQLSVSDDTGQGERPRVDVFSAASGEFQSQLLSPATAAGEQLQNAWSIAVKHETGETYLGVRKREAGNGLVDVFSKTGALLSTWTGAHTPSGSFGSNPVVVAVDNDKGNLNDWAAGDVFVGRTPAGLEAGGEVDIFAPQAGGLEPAQLVGPPLTGTCASPGVCPGEEIPFMTGQNFINAIAVDESNGDLLVASDTKKVDILRPSPLVGQYEFVTQIPEPPSGPLQPLSVAVAGGASDAGDIYVASEQGLIYELKFTSAADESVEYVGRIADKTHSLAVDPTNGDLYTDSRIYGPDLALPDVTVTEPVVSLTATSVAFRGTVNPVGDGEATCEFEYGTDGSYDKHAPCTQSVAEGDAPVAVESARVTRLQPDTTYDYRLSATSLGDGQTTTGEGAADIGSFTTAGAGVVSESAMEVASTSATLDAAIDPNGASTTYYFQYGTSMSYEHEAPLKPGTPIGSGSNPVTVQGQQLEGLAADTTYHYRVVALSEVLVEVAADDFEKQLVAFAGADRVFTTQSATGTFGLLDGRSWEMVSPVDKHGARILPPTSTEQVNLGGVYRYVEQAAVDGDAVSYVSTQPTEAQPQGYAGLVQVFATRSPDGGWVSQDISTPHETAAGLAFGEYTFFSEDLSSSVVVPYNSVVNSLSDEASEQTPYIRTDYFNGAVGEHCAEGCYQPVLSGCPPIGVPCAQPVEEHADVPPGTVFGGRSSADEDRGSGDFAPRFVGASPDLSYVLLEVSAALKPGEVPGVYLWSAGKPPSERVALAGCAQASTVNIEESENSSENLIPPLFICEEKLFDVSDPSRSILLAGGLEGIAGGSKAFYGGGRECEVELVAGRPECVAVPGPEVQLAAKSSSGAYVYGFSSSVLSGAPNSMGESAQPGAPNFYMRHFNGSAWEEAKFITSAFTPPQKGTPGPVRVSPNGKWMTFKSGGEAYVYGAEDQRLVCASCNPTGALQTGQAGDPSIELLLYSQGFYQPRFLSDQGQLFFDSSEALVPKDVDGQTDVYEYEPEGVGSCRTTSGSGSVVFVRQSAGCIGLISSGESTAESLFIDASANGSDVFFYTLDKLLPEDIEGSFSVYDAHECTSAAPCPTAHEAQPPCDTADACKPAPTPQPSIFGDPSSATFSGAGNISPKPPATTSRKASCAKGKQLEHGVCVKHKGKAAKKRTRKKTRKKKAARNAGKRTGMGGGRRVGGARKASKGRRAES